MVTSPSTVCSPYCSQTEISFFLFKWPSLVIPRFSQTSCSFSSIQSWGGDDAVCEAFKSSGFQNLNWPETRAVSLTLLKGGIKRFKTPLQETLEDFLGLGASVVMSPNTYNRLFASTSKLATLGACNGAHHHSIWAPPPCLAKFLVNFMGSSAVLHPWLRGAPLGAGILTVCGGWGERLGCCVSQLKEGLHQREDLAACLTLTCSIMGFGICTIQREGNSFDAQMPCSL